MPTRTNWLIRSRTFVSGNCYLQLCFFAVIIDVIDRTLFLIGLVHFFNCPSVIDREIFEGRSKREQRDREIEKKQIEMQGEDSDKVSE
jgi:hypothetical protein